MSLCSVPLEPGRFSCHFGKIHIDVLQPRKAWDKGKSVKASSSGWASSGVQTSCASDVSANSVRPCPPCRFTAVPSIPTASASQTAPATDVEEDADPDEAVPHLDDEDELMFPELVDRFSQHTMEDGYTEELSRPARFDDTDDEEKDENNDSLVAVDYNGEDMPTIEWNRKDPKLTPGTVFESMQDFRNALTTYCILTQNNFVIVKSGPTRFIVKCPYERCRWRMHASTMARSTVVQMKSFSFDTAEDYEDTRFGATLLDIVNKLELPVPTLKGIQMTKFQKEGLWGIRVTQAGRESAKDITIKLLHDERHGGIDIVMQDLIGHLCRRHSSELKDHYTYSFGRREDSGEAIEYTEDAKKTLEPVRRHLQDLEFHIRSIDTDRNNELIDNDDLLNSIIATDL
ncbi:hypothetical protein ACQ4PT_050586 [Festuca glaucescens]